ncbi:MAG: HEAT repeat domain-containing protein [Candidatus Omnitrophica bacterium]|nr:HEAT repeat domain-containing protein [Candidatus Omnitrophota bacterium]
MGLTMKRLGIGGGSCCKPVKPVQAARPAAPVRPAEPVKPVEPRKEVQSTSIFTPFFMQKPVALKNVQEKAGVRISLAAAAAPEKKLVSKGESLKGMEFGSKSEELKAEIFYTDLLSSSKKVRMQALAHLKDLPKPVAVKLLEKLLASESDTLKTIENLNCLAGLGEEDVIPKKIFRDYVSHSDVGVRLAAFRAISKYSDREGFDILSASAKDPNPEVRRQILNCLCWSFADKSLPYVMSGLHDSDSGVRKAAGRIAGALRAPQAISGLITLLSDTDKEVQASAAESLKKITGENFSFRVNASKKDKDAAIEDWRYWWRENQVKFALGKKANSK